MKTEDEVRATIRDLWSQVLENDELAGDTDFFAAGGSSLKSLILLTELNEAFETEFEIAELVDCRTIDRQFVAVWNRLHRGESATPHQQTVIVPLARANGEQDATIIAIHDVSGDVYGYTSLARELSGQADLHGIKLAHERFEAPRALSIAGLAEEYVAALESEFDGPRRFVLVGWSLGGPVGFEMAKLLEERGRPIERLVLVDSPYDLDLPSPDNAGAFTPEHERALLDEFTWLGDPPYPHGASVEEMWRAVRTRVDTPAKERLATELQDRFPLMARVIPHLASLNETEFICYVNRFRSVFRAGRNHRPEGTITAPIDLLTATRSRNFDPRWFTHTSATVRRQALDGDHFTILDRGSAPATARAILTPDTTAEVRHADSVTPHLGPQDDSETIERTLREFGDQVSWTRLPGEEVVDQVAELLTGKVVIGWFQGRAEHGSGTLGHRGILANPGFPDIEDVISTRIERPEQLRPFAPIVLESDAVKVFEMGRGTGSPYPTSVVPVRPQYQDVIPGATHADGTADVQTVTDEDAPRLASLLRRFSALTGVPCLITTSWDMAGEPVECSPADALHRFLATEIDYLVLGDHLVTKRDGSA
ncbi:alpha/beta fold hydrolase [Streptomyces phaeoluteigriseus]|uniref:alpha/beta fold hydrolase n=1 Tax=Streptomyces phaeoluteigriseus TaxID=114686 RepID=UPI0036929AB4